MTCHLSPLFQDAQFDANGAYLSGGKLYWYLSGTLTPATTYADSLGTYPNTNPIILNSRGEPPQPIWLTDGVSYKAQLNTSLDVAVRPAIENITGVNSVLSTTTGIEWTTSGLTPTYISPTQFSVPGDQTSILVVSRRLKITLSIGAIYGTVTASSYGAGVTTVSVAGDSVSLDSSISAFSYGTLSPSNSSVPKTYTDGWGGTAGGTADALTISVIPALGSYQAGQTFKFIPSANNATTTPTLNVNGLGAKTIRGRSFSGSSPLLANQLVAGQEISVVYDGTYFILEVGGGFAGTLTLTATGSFTVPGCNYVKVTCIGAGGGGGSGRRGAASSLRYGGAGGGGGAVRTMIFTATQIGGVGAIIPCTVPAGGIGGTAISANDIDGLSAASVGAVTAFGTFLTANFGAAGAGGTAVSATGGTGGSITNSAAGLLAGGAGGVANAAGSSADFGGGGGGGGGAGPGNGGSSFYSSGAGGGGGSISAGDTEYAGAAGGTYQFFGAGSGGAGGAIGVAGTAGTQDPMGFAGSGGGGGGASKTAVAGNGGAGGVGAGGGGGGASLNGNNSGAGGNGGRGEIRIWWW